MATITFSSPGLSAKPVTGSTTKEFWEDPIWVLILIIWNCALTIWLIVHCACFICICSKRTKRRERESLRKKYENYFDSPQGSPPISPMDAHNSHQNKALSRNNSIHSTNPEWIKSMKDDAVYDYQIDTIDRETRKNSTRSTSRYDEVTLDEHLQGNGNGHAGVL